MCRNAYWMAVLCFFGQFIGSSAVVVHHADLRGYAHVSSEPRFPETVSLAHSLWNNTIASKMHDFIDREVEIYMPEPPAPTSDKLIYSLLGLLIFPGVGFDRCFMGQVGLGFAKGLTCGGCMCWAFVDYFFCFYIALSKAKEINALGYNGKFTESTIDPAFWTAVALLVWQFVVVPYWRYRSLMQVLEMQQNMLEILEEKEAEQRAAQGKVGEAQQREQRAAQAREAIQKARGAVAKDLEENFGGVSASVKSPPPLERQSSIASSIREVPKSHQALTLVPKSLTKALRQAGALTDKPTVPELIQMFHDLDKDNNGVLDKNEIKEALERMGVKGADVDEMIKNADKNGDGKIDKAEFLLSN